MLWEVPERPMESIAYSGRLGNPREIGGVSTGSYCTKIKCTPHRADTPRTRRHRAFVYGHAAKAHEDLRLTELPLCARSRCAPWTVLRVGAYARGQARPPR